MNVYMYMFLYIDSNIGLIYQMMELVDHDRPRCS